MVQRSPCVVRPLFAQVLVAVIIGGLVRPPVGWAEGPTLVPRLSLTASGGPSITVVAIGLDPRAQGGLGPLEVAAEGALARSGRFTVIPVQDAASPDASRARQEKLAEARAKVRVGRRALDELDNVKATGALTDALAALRRTDLTRTFSELIGAWVLKAASHATGSENEPAKRDLEAALALSPATELSATFFSADLVAYGEAQRKAAISAKSELTIRTEPAGAQVWLDGVYRGGSPVTVGGLAATPHLVSAVLGGSQLTQVDFLPGQETIKLDPAELGNQWRRAQWAVASDPDGPGRDRAAVDLGRQLGVDQVLLIVAQKSLIGDKLELIGARLEVRDGHNAAWRAATLPEAGAGWDAFFDELAATDTPHQSGAPMTHFHTGFPPTSRLVPSLALAGGGAVAAVVGVIFGVLALDQQRQFHEHSSNPARQARFEEDGRAFGAVADISYLVGIAAAATGAVLWLTAPKRSETADPSPEPAPPRDEPARIRPASSGP